jgi:hypothetical protein
VGRPGDLEIWSKAAGERVKCEGVWRGARADGERKTTRTRWKGCDAQQLRLGSVDTVLYSALAS